MLSLDDQNDWVGFLADHPGTRTPNLDELAAQSVVFDRAYTAAPMCKPARTAIYYGQPPDVSKVYDHSETSNRELARIELTRPSLIDSFWSGGYRTIAAGKLEPGASRRSDVVFNTPQLEIEDDWRSPYDGKPVEGVEPAPGAIDFGPTGRPLDEEPDVLAARWVAEQIARTEEPFFLGYGTIRPHTPWRVPRQFLDAHPLDEVVVPEIREDDFDDLSTYAREDMAKWGKAFEKLRDLDLWAPAVQAYQASTTFADHCVGIVLDALAESRHADNTIVLVFSDHGFHLGEKLHLHKFTLWEEATRVPFLVRAPGLEARRFDTPVSTMDLGPTAASLAGVELNWPHEGIDLVPALDDPTIADEHPPVMTWLEGNHAVRKRNWRYIRYRTGDVELYDLDTDPGEFDNLAGRPDLSEVEAELDAYLPDS